MQSGVCGVCWIGNTQDRFVVGGDDGVVTIVTSDLEVVNATTVHNDIVSAVSYDRVNADKFVSCSIDGECCVWDCGDARAHVVGQYRAHNGAINSIAHCSTISEYCTVGYDRVARVWDMRCVSGQPVSSTRLPQTPSVCEWGNTAIGITCGFDDGSLCRIDTRKSNTLIPASFRHDGRVTSLLRRGESTAELLSTSQDR